MTTKPSACLLPSFYGTPFFLGNGSERTTGVFYFCGGKALPPSKHLAVTMGLLIQLDASGPAVPVGVNLSLWSQCKNIPVSACPF